MNTILLNNDEVYITENNTVVYLTEDLNDLMKTGKQIINSSTRKISKNFRNLNIFNKNMEMDAKRNEKAMKKNEKAMYETAKKYLGKSKSEIDGYTATKSKELVKMLSSNNSPNKLVDMINNNFIAEIIRDMSDDYDQALYTNYEKAMMFSFHTTLVINIIYNVCKLLFGVNIGFIIVGCIVGPIIQENLKHIAIEKGFIKEFLVFYNIYESTFAILKFGPIFGFKKILALRGTTTLVQCTTAAVQGIFRSYRDEKEEFTGEDGSAYTAIGLMLATVLNMLYVTIGNLI